MAYGNGAPVQQPTGPVPAHVIRFRTPVVDTPAILLIGRWLWRALVFGVCFPFRYPATAAALFLLGAGWWLAGWVGPAAVCSVTTMAGLAWWWVCPTSFRRLVGLRALGLVRRVWVYRRHWQPVLVVAGLAESYHERHFLPQIRSVVCTEWADRVRVRLVAGTAPSDFDDRTAPLAHGFGAPSCRWKCSAPATSSSNSPERICSPTPSAHCRSPTTPM